MYGLLCQDLVAQHRLTRQGKLPPMLRILSTLQDEFSGTTLPESSRGEASIMLFDKRFKRYEDLLE